MKLNQNLFIYVRNYSEWIDLQNYLFFKGFEWSGMHKKQLFTKWNYESDLIFPRYLVINFYKKRNKYFMANLNNSENECLSNKKNYPILNAATLLRKQKLNNINDTI